MWIRSILLIAIHGMVLDLISITWYSVILLNTQPNTILSLFNFLHGRNNTVLLLLKSAQYLLCCEFCMQWLCNLSDHVFILFPWICRSNLSISFTSMVVEVFLLYGPPWPFIWAVVCECSVIAPMEIHISAGAWPPSDALGEFASIVWWVSLYAWEILIHKTVPSSYTLQSCHTKCQWVGSLVILFEPQMVLSFLLERFCFTCLVPTTQCTLKPLDW